jgi:transposase-like protein
MCTVKDSEAEVKREPRAHWRARVRKEVRQEQEESRAIFGDPEAEKPKPRKRRREEMHEKVKEYQKRFPRRNSEFRREVEESVLQRVGRKFQEAFAARVTAVLGRAEGVHRDPRDRTVVPEFCSECDSHRRADFYRDGYWTRYLHTRWGRVRLRVPRVRCDCGGAVVIAYEQFAPYQRQFEDIQGQILGLSALCLSLRQIRAVLVMNGTRLSIATLCKEIGKVADLTASEFKRKCGVAPVVLLDGIWGNLARETGEKFTNARGQNREHKEVEKVPLLVAWGIWPETGKKALLGWVVGKQEDEASWKKLLEALHARGLHADKGLRLFVSDGSSGLEAALAMVSFGQVPHQRCVFHKIRNVLDKVKGEAVEGDQKAKREARKKRREEVLADLSSIWQAASEAEARRRYEAFVAKWEAKEPEAVARLRNGFAATLVFYAVQAQAAAKGEHWEARYLRTTSPLERANRNIRVKLRAATTFQTEEGLLANVYLALGVRGKKEPVEIHEWIEGIVGRIEELQRAA